MQGLTILVADANPKILVLMRTMLQKANAKKILMASSGTDAFDVLRFSGTVDCIIAEAAMPSGSGFQLLQSIRCGEVVPHRPNSCFIIMSNALDERAMKAARILDANGFLKKPFAPPLLEAEIRKARGRVYKPDVQRYRSISTDEINLGEPKAFAT